MSNNIDVILDSMLHYTLTKRYGLFILTSFGDSCETPTEGKIEATWTEDQSVRFLSVIKSGFLSGEIPEITCGDDFIHDLYHVMHDFSTELTIESQHLGLYND
jgi:hypothetical protein